VNPREALDAVREASTRADAVHIAGDALKAGATLDEAHEAVRLWDALQARSVQRIGGGS
jgi:hypothetical protein